MCVMVLWICFYWESGMNLYLGDFKKAVSSFGSFYLLNLQAKTTLSYTAFFIIIVQQHVIRLTGRLNSCFYINY